LNKISGKIINYNESFLGEIIFDNNIKNISKLLDIKDEEVAHILSPFNI